MKPVRLLYHIQLLQSGLLLTFKPKASPYFAFLVMVCESVRVCMWMCESVCECVRVCESPPLTDRKHVYGILLKLYGLVLWFCWRICLGSCQVGSFGSAQLCFNDVRRIKTDQIFWVCLPKTSLMVRNLEALELKGPCESSGSGQNWPFITSVFWSLK